ncbi:MAG: peptidyl-prolyl cis-trans isomerase [Planctomycetes bacterium]|nr:peptidyl-prolyl cis-trans isomerase [Planctomycetota bacterium]
MKVYYFVILVCAFTAGSVSAANPQVTLHITGGVVGDIVLELYPDEAPVTVENFINYVQSGFYDGLIFHRVIPGFMIQGGGFNTEPNIVPTNPPIINEGSNNLSNFPGTVAMARILHPDSATSQFFINHGNNTASASIPPATNLDEILFESGGSAYLKYGYAVFGQVIGGMDIVNAIAAVQTHDGVVTDTGTLDDVPVIDIVIDFAEITLNVPVCSVKMPGDADGDCDVDLADLAMLAGNWLACNAINDCQ